MKRLVTVAESMLEVSKKNRKRTNSSTSGDVLEDLDQYPFFTHAGIILYENPYLIYFSKRFVLQIYRCYRRRLQEKMQRRILLHKTHLLGIN
jgi:hypothetical protein